jgi:hypothetical protein
LGKDNDFHCDPSELVERATPNLRSVEEPTTMQNDGVGHDTPLKIPTPWGSAGPILQV